jgi:hypothetical protein
MIEALKDKGELELVSHFEKLAASLAGPLMSEL